MEEQIVELEIKLAYQDRRLGELDALVRSLGERVAVLERELADVRRGLAPETRVNDPPPHY